MSKCIRSAWLVAFLAVSSCATSPIDADRAAANAYVHEYYAWTQTLTADGENLGNRIFDVIEEKASEEDATAAIHDVLYKCQARLAQMKKPTARLVPAAFAEWHAQATDYVKWQCDVISRDQGKMLIIAADTTKSRQQRGKEILDVAKATEPEELARKAEIEAATKKLYDAIGGTVSR